MTTLCKWYVGIALFFAMILDGSLALAFQKVFYHPNWGAACWFTVVGICLIALFDDLNKNNIWLVLGIGILADSYYFGYFGIYTVAFPLVYFILQKLTRFLPETLWFRLIICLLAYLFVSLYVFLIYAIIGTQQIGFETFLLSILPSWLVCVIIFFITYAFWKNLIEKYPFLESQRTYL
ncbi:rod shape-determining protein MreD [Lactobacillus sp. PV034]|uniref:rod shape-determining protein MreD n=1 Tax=Lactobacillus sp. PV034 TaxID=2594495 RepID=UPI002240724A|nr:rod shape-determining protein MreD [Lactobacillus sp. PV034]QNQ80617.1 rod shape-determining protein MreD [Lactobacillus sp. PV034]